MRILRAEFIACTAEIINRIEKLEFVMVSLTEKKIGQLIGNENIQK